MARQCSSSEDAKKTAACYQLNVARGKGNDDRLTAVRAQADATADPYAALPPGHPLRAQLERFDAAGKLIGGWTCDGGAAALSRLLDIAGIPNEPVVGLYYWREEHWPVYWQMTGRPETIGPGHTEPEHHHWVEVDDYLLDPNGEVRLEPRVQLLEEALKTIDPADRWSPSRYSRASKRQVLELSSWYEPPSDEDWEAGHDGELIIPAAPEYERELPGWEALGLL